MGRGAARALPGWTHALRITHHVSYHGLINAYAAVLEHGEEDPPAAHLL